MNQNRKTSWQIQENLPYANINKGPQLILQIDTHKQLTNAMLLNTKNIPTNELAFNSDSSTFNPFNQSSRQSKDSFMVTQGKTKCVSSNQMQQGQFYNLNKPKESEHPNNTCYQFDNAFIEMSSFQLDPQNCPNDKNQTINPNILDSELSEFVQNLSFEPVESLDNSQMEEQSICQCDDPECLWNNLKRSRNGDTANANPKFNQQSQPPLETVRSGIMSQELNNSFEKFRSAKVRIGNNLQIHRQQNAKANIFESPEDKLNFSKSLETNRQISFLQSFSEIEEQEQLEYLLLEMENNGQLDRKLQINLGTNSKDKN